jgi:hypothetical protein
MSPEDIDRLAVNGAFVKARQNAMDAFLRAVELPREALERDGRALAGMMLGWLEEGSLTASQAGTLERTFASNYVTFYQAERAELERHRL